jgi:HAD superfamily hydrolase (TIGR01549 family)
MTRTAEWRCINNFLSANGPKGRMVREVRGRINFYNVLALNTFLESRILPKYNCKMKFPAVAFDLDGTLYPNYRLNVRLVPFILKEQRLLRAFRNARIRLRKSGRGAEGDFYDEQAKITGDILGENADKVKEKIEKLIYRGWEDHFKKIRLFPHVAETLDALCKNGIKLGLLSDFPPETKLKNLGIFDCWDAIVCSEQIGYLKPDTASLLEMAKQMSFAPEQILYVGNSVPYDVAGAHKAGMKAALVSALPFLYDRKADFVFSDYRKLRDYVLG